MERRLAAILAADVVGYSRLMGVNEAGTLTALKAHREELVQRKIAEHGGRIVKLTGDGILVEFPSVVNAVACAVDIQRHMRGRNADVPPDQRVEFRIGVNLGDIIVEDNDIYGDGVNVAARVEAVAKAGGVAVSATVRDHIGNKLALGFEDRGEQTLKNIDLPVRIFDVILDLPAERQSAVPSSSSAASARRQRLLSFAGLAAIIVVGSVAFWANGSLRSSRLADNTTADISATPSIAVLPFRAIGVGSGVFTDGLAQSVTTALSSVPGLLVIARQSLSSYAGVSVDLARVSAEQGVQNILSGSVQVDGTRLRISVQLVDAASGRVLWSERYDRITADFFDVQDDISLNVASSLQFHLTEGEQAKMRRSGTSNLEAWKLATQSYEAFQRYDPASLEESARFAQQAIDLDPSYAWPWAVLSGVRLTRARFGFSSSPQTDLYGAKSAADQAISLNPQMAIPHCTLGVYHLMRSEFTEAEASCRHAITLEPSNSEGYAILAQILFFRGRWKEAIEMSDRATHLSPYHPQFYLVWKTLSEAFLRDYDAALASAQRQLEISSSPFQKASTLHCMAFILQESGRTQEAAEAIRKSLLEMPALRLDFLRRSFHFENPKNLERYLSVLVKAGLS